MLLVFPDGGEESVETADGFAFRSTPNQCLPGSLMIHRHDNHLVMPDLSGGRVRWRPGQLVVWTTSEKCLETTHLRPYDHHLAKVCIYRLACFQGTGYGQ